MRKLFWILLLANAGLFAVMRNGGLGWGEPEVQAQPPLNSGMIRLIHGSPDDPATSGPHKDTQTAPAPAQPAVVKVEPAKVAVQAEPPPTPEPPKQADNTDTAPVAATVCLEWGDFSGPDLTRATAELTAMRLGDRLSHRQIERDVKYWVYFPPLRNKAAVKRKIAEIRALGINEYFVVQTPGHWLNAISLGVFKTQDAAENFLHDMNKAGVHTARVGERTSKVKTTIFMLKGVDAATVSKLTEMQKDFTGSELSNVPCAVSGKH